MRVTRRSPICGVAVLDRVVIGGPFELAQRAADELRTASGVDRYDVAIVLGSGWRAGARALGPPTSDVATDSLTGFVAPTAMGHDGRILSLVVGGQHVALISGRVHLYEGCTASQVVHSVRTIITAGASTVVLTNASGGVDTDREPGTVVLIRDHLNLTGTSPLEGVTPSDSRRSPFVDVSDLYSARLRAIAHTVDPDLSEGVYAGVRGPHYETPAEISMIRILGASLVGMSTVLEAIAARHLGAEVLGLGLVSNYAAGVTERPLDHRDVLAVGENAAISLGTLLARLVPVL